MRWLLLGLLALGVGCVDSPIGRETVGGGPAPPVGCLEADAVVDLGRVTAEGASGEFAIWNPCNGPLEIHALEIEGDADHLQLEPLPSVVLLPGEVFEVGVSVDNPQSLAPGPVLWRVVLRFDAPDASQLAVRVIGQVVE